VFSPLITFLPQGKSNRCFTLSKHRPTKITKRKDLVNTLQIQNNLAQINLFFRLDLAPLKKNKAPKRLCGQYSVLYWDPGVSYSPVRGIYSFCSLY
jgi:hypothetical protein